MAIGLIGRKCGMTRVFTEGGESLPVTVIEVAPNRVTQIKDLDKDGYRAVQVTTGARRAKLLSKAKAGHFARAGVDAGRGSLGVATVSSEQPPELNLVDWAGGQI